MGVDRGGADDRYFLGFLEGEQASSGIEREALRFGLVRAGELRIGQVRVGSNLRGFS